MFILCIEYKALNTQIILKTCVMYCFCQFVGGSQIEVKLVLPWKDPLKIEYTAIASWPLDASK